jgi:hypothetical protein
MPWLVVSKTSATSDELRRAKCPNEHRKAKIGERALNEGGACLLSKNTVARCAYCLTPIA